MVPVFSWALLLLSRMLLFGWLQFAPRLVALPRLKLSSTVRDGSGTAIVSVSVALLLVVFGSVMPAGAATVAVLASVPDPLTVPLSVKVR